MNEPGSVYYALRGVILGKHVVFDDLNVTSDASYVIFDGSYVLGLGPYVGDFRFVRGLPTTYTIKKLNYCL